MSFELFDKQRRRTRQRPTVSIRSNGVLGFNRRAVEITNSPVYVELLYDKESNRIAFRTLTERTPSSFKVRKYKESATVSAVAFLDYYQIKWGDISRKYVIYPENGMWILDVDSPIVEDKRVLEFGKARQAGPKECTSCGETKDPEEFWKNLTSKDGRYSVCSECMKIKRSGNTLCTECRQSRPPTAFTEGSSVCKVCVGEKISDSRLKSPLVSKTATNSYTCKLCGNKYPKQKFKKAFSKGFRLTCEDCLEAIPTDRKESKKLDETESHTGKKDSGRGGRPTDPVRVPIEQERRCIKGRMCLSFPDLGAPAKLSAYNSGQRCEQCENARVKPPLSHVPGEPMRGKRR